MSKIFFPVIPALLLLFSCTGGPGKIVLNPIEMRWLTDDPYIITEHQNTAAGTEMPDWVIAFIDGGLAEAETLAVYQGRHVFVARNESNNFTAMNHWMTSFSPELDFPRLAAARVEARFFSAAPLPDQEYGAFFEAMIRTASDFPWTGAIREHDFWIRKNYLPTEEEGERETWEFMILLTVERTGFLNQLEEVFRRIKPNPAPTKDQTNAINRVKDRFFDGF